MLEVHQPWDPLTVCAVGRSYPPEFYNWIKVPHVRKLFEKIAQETEEDYQNLISTLKKFNVEIVRPDKNTWRENKIIKEPPMNPRDHMIMIGNILYFKPIVQWQKFYDSVKDSSWPTVSSIEQLPLDIQDECINQHGWGDPLVTGHPEFCEIFKFAMAKGITIKSAPFDKVNGAETTRVGKDLFFGTHDYHENPEKIEILAKESFPHYNTHVINTGGHSDGTFCPVIPGLIFSLHDVPTYKDTFPGWEVVYLPNQSWAQVKPFLDLKQKNKGKWWIPGFEYDNEVTELIETWLSHWVGYVEETVFDVNMLTIDEKNVVVFGYNEIVFDTLSRYNITPHIVPLRHRYFWDGGIHCVTTDLGRTGKMQDFFNNSLIK
jgi:hypothetical protein